MEVKPRESQRVKILYKLSLYNDMILSDEPQGYDVKKNFSTSSIIFEPTASLVMSSRSIHHPIWLTTKSMSPQVLRTVTYLSGS